MAVMWLERVRSALRVGRQGPDISFDLPAAPLSALLPGAEKTEVSFPVAEAIRTKNMVLPIGDLVTVGAICRTLRPKKVFEIGTYTGSTTLMMAMNTPTDTELFTLDLPPEELLPGMPPFRAGSRFLDTPYAHKIRQLFGHSESFDYSPYEGSIDLVFVDALHTYEAVRRDTASALRMLRPGGVVIWDDYLWLPEHSECAGVTRWLNEFRHEKPCYQLEGTRLAVHVGRPAGTA